MLANYHAEAFVSHVENERSRQLFLHPFSGKSGEFPLLVVRHRSLLIVLIALGLALVTGLILQFGLGTGPFTLLLGCLGALPSFCYTMRASWVTRGGLGELLIASVYGWLSLAAAFYLQQGHIASCIHWMSLPIGLSLFNVVLLHEFQDHAAFGPGTRDLLALLGLSRGRALYGLVSLLSWLSMYFALNAGIPQKALYLYFPVLLVSAVVSLLLAWKKDEDPVSLEVLCGLNLAVHFGTVASYFLAFL
jgi:1,4-dihydroxy-2-naphthoate octaprenyltransferase